MPTTKEKVAKRIEAGEKPAEIASALGVSRGTVYRHRRQLSPAGTPRRRSSRRGRARAQRPQANGTTPDAVKRAAELLAGRVSELDAERERLEEARKRLAS